MALYGEDTEYVPHSLLWLVDTKEPLSSLDPADLQEIPGSFMVELLSKPQKAGTFHASEEMKGSHVLARLARKISALSDVDAIEEHKSQLNCQQI